MAGLSSAFKYVWEWLAQWVGPMVGASVVINVVALTCWGESLLPILWKIVIVGNIRRPSTLHHWQKSVVRGVAIFSSNTNNIIGPRVRLRYRPWYGRMNKSPSYILGRILNKRRFHGYSSRSSLLWRLQNSWRQPLHTRSFQMYALSISLFFSTDHHRSY